MTRINTDRAGRLTVQGAQGREKQRQINGFGLKVIRVDPRHPRGISAAYFRSGTTSFASFRPIVNSDTLRLSSFR
jgi:hypothetical protein